MRERDATTAEQCFADDLLRLLDVRAGSRLLVVGAGTGALALAAAARGAEVLAVDSASGVLAVEDSGFDTAASLFGLAGFPDVEAGACELRRVVRLGGEVAVATWERDGFAVHDLALEAIGESGLGDPAALEQLLSAAGLHEIRVESVRRRRPVGSGGPGPHALVGLGVR